MITLITVMMMIGSKVKYIYVLEAWDGWEQGGSKQWVRSWQCGEGLEDCWEEGETDYYIDYYDDDDVGDDDH